MFAGGFFEEEVSLHNIDDRAILERSDLAFFHLFSVEFNTVPGNDSDDCLWPVNNVRLVRTRRKTGRGRSQMLPCDHFRWKRRLRYGHDSVRPLELEGVHDSSRDCARIGNQSRYNDETSVSLC